MVDFGKALARKREKERAAEAARPSRAEVEAALEGLAARALDEDALEIPASVEGATVLVTLEPARFRVCAALGQREVATRDGSAVVAASYPWGKGWAAVLREAVEKLMDALADRSLACEGCGGPLAEERGSVFCLSCPMVLDPTCPTCRRRMLVRRAQGTAFWGCSGVELDPPCRKALRWEEAKQRPSSPGLFHEGPEGSEALALYHRARKLVEGFLARVPSTDPLTVIARKLQVLLAREPERAVRLIVGELTPTGNPTFEAKLRARAAKKKAGGARRVEWGEKTIRAARAGLVDYDPATRPAEPYVEVTIGPEGGPGVESSAFPHHKLRHARLNCVQAEVLPWIDRDVNIVVAASTSAGKTVVAEMGIAAALARKGKGIFLSPLRAVSQEKYDEWRAPEHPWGRRNVEIVTGDYSLTEARKKALRAADVIVMTSEMLDSKTRRMAQEGNDWLLRTLCLVVDEAHLLTMAERGDALECGVMRFSRQNPQSRIVFLSATMPNVDQLGRWLTHLNGKPTVVVRSAWRPTKLTVHWTPYKDRGSYHDKEEAKRAVALQIVRRERADKFLIFVHSKKAGGELMVDLRECGITAEFHNADLDRDRRLTLERRFRTGDLRVVIATSTLAYGINMPARRVIVLGVHRGMEEVDPIDVQQEIGRAGRMGIDPEGDAYVLVPESQQHSVRERFSRVGEIRSKLNELDTLAFHLTAEVAEGDVHSEEEAVSWHLRSLAAFQGQPIDAGQALAPLGTPERQVQLDRGQHEAVSAANVMGRLARAGILKQDEATKRYEATMLGRVSSWLYFSPFDVADWCSNFRKLLERDKLRDDECLAWALGQVRTAFGQYVPRECEDELAELCWRLRSKGIEVTKPTAVALAAYGALRGQDMRSLAAVQRGFVQDSERVCQAIDMIDRYVIKGLGSGYAHLLGLRLRYGCDWREALLCQLPGIGGKRARMLVEAGITRVEDVLARPGRVAQAIGKTHAANAIRGAKLLVRGQPSQSGRP